MSEVFRAQAWEEKGFLPHGPALEDNDWRLLRALEVMHQVEAEQMAKTRERSQDDDEGDGSSRGRPHLYSDGEARQLATAQPTGRRRPTAP